MEDAVHHNVPRQQGTAEKAEGVNEQRTWSNSILQISAASRW